MKRMTHVSGRFLIVLWTIFLLLGNVDGASLAFAVETQDVSIFPSSQVKYTEQHFTVSVLYDVSNNDNSLEGLEINVHFDSTKLFYENYSGFLSRGDIRNYPQLLTDTGNEDGDGTTDGMINTGWASLTSNWPGTDIDLPVKLLDLHFSVKPDAPVGITPINISVSDGAPGYNVNTTNSTLTILLLPAGPTITDLRENGQSANHDDVIVLKDHVSDTIFTFRIAAENTGAVSPGPYNSIAVYLSQLDSPGDKGRVSLSEKSSDLNYGEFFGNEASAGDGFTEYVMVESVDTDDWNSNEENFLELNIRPKEYGDLYIYYRVGMSNDHSWTHGWEYSPSSGAYLDPLGLQAYRVRVVVEEPMAPAKPGPLDLAEDDDSGYSVTDNITNTVGQRIIVPGEEGATVKLYNGGVEIAGAGGMVSSGIYQAVLSLPEGTHSITAIQTDPAGYTSPESDPLVVTIDTTAPGPPLNLDLAAEDDSGAYDDDNFTYNSDSLTITGTGEDGTVVWLRDGSANVAGATGSVQN